MRSDEYAPEIASAIELRDSLLAFDDWYGELVHNAISLRQCLTDLENSVSVEDYYLAHIEEQNSEAVLPRECHDDLTFLRDSWGAFSSEYFRLKKAIEAFHYGLMDDSALPHGSRWSTRLVLSVNKMVKPLRESLNVIGDRDPDEMAHPRKSDTGFEFILGRILGDNFPEKNWNEYFDRVLTCVDELEAVIINHNALLPKPSDGPFGVYTWRHNGEVIDDRMRPMAWKLARLLHEQSPAMLTYQELAEPVFGDRVEYVDSDRVGTHRKLANKFFEENNVPLRVRTSDGRVFLETVTR